MAHNFQVNDLVDVRADFAHPWRAGVVSEVRATRYVVALVAPLPVNTWTGKTRKIGGNPNISTVEVAKAAACVCEDQHIKVRV